MIIRENSPLLFIFDALRLVRTLRKQGIDIIFDLEFFSRLSAILSYLCCSGKRIGFHNYTFEGLYRGNLLTHKVQYNPLIHISKSYLSLGQAIVRKEKNSPELEDKIEESKISFPRYVSDANTKEKLLVKLRRSGVDFDEAGRKFLLHPGEGTLPLREWPVENFIQLSRLILEEKSSHIFIIGTDGAQGKAELIVNKIDSPRCISLVNQIELDMFFELFTMSDVLISNDCGLAHSAMLTQIKKFILFGPESPQIFGPLGDNNWVIYSNWSCSPCLSVFNHRKSSCKNNWCLKAINCEEVYRLIKQNM